MMTVNHPSKILFINPYGVGDVLFTTPVLSLVKKYFPQSVIGYLCNERTKVILEASPMVNSLFVFEKDQYRKLWKENKEECFRRSMALFRQIKQQRFDVALDYSLSRQYGFVLAALGIPIRIGYDYRGRGVFLNRKVEMKELLSQPMPVFYCRLLEELKLSVDNNNIPLMHYPLAESVMEWAEEFFNSQGILSKERFIIIHPGGGMSWGNSAVYKRWPAASFVDLVKLLRKHYGVKIFLLGDSLDSLAVSSLVSELNDSGVISIFGKLNLNQLAAILGRAWFVVCNDGGPLHIAVSRGARTVSFFGPVDELVYGPFPRDGHLVLTNPVECRPCYQNFKFPPCPYEHRCLKELSVEYAFEKIKEVFN
jgi:ADP-heptose:LPS heptosyltransferase